MIRPSVEDDDNQWEGAITSLKHRIKKTQDHISKELKSTTSEIMKGQRVVIQELRDGQQSIKDELREGQVNLKDELKTGQKQIKEAMMDPRAASKNELESSQPLKVPDSSKLSQLGSDVKQISQRLTTFEEG